MSIRNEVDLISNAVSVHWLPLSDKGLDKEILLPDEQLPIAMHEMVHWQCFQSVLGHSFFVLWDSIVAGTRDAQVKRSIFSGSIPRRFERALQNFKLGLEFYSPIIEGVALFAQFDSAPGHAKAASKATIYLHALSFLSRAMNEGFESQDDLIEFEAQGYIELKASLLRTRQSILTRRQKIDLLSCPMISEQGHYLAGYLLIKALYAKSFEKSPLFLDTDFFLSFVCSCFFHDAGAATIVLNIDMDADEFILQIKSRMEQRIALFSSDKIAYLASAYESDCVCGAPSDAVLGGIELTSEDWAACRSAEQVIQNAFIRESKLLAVAQNLVGGVDPASLIRVVMTTHRGLLRLRRLTGNAAVSEDRVTISDAAGQIIAQVQKVGGVDTDAIYPASYTLYFDPNRIIFARTIVTMHGEHPILGQEFQSIQEMSQADIALIKFAILYGERHEFNRDQPGGMNDIVEVLDKILETTEIDTIRASAIEVAMSTILQGVARHIRPELIEKINLQGIFGWLGSSYAIAECAAAFSLTGSHNATSPANNIYSGSDFAAIKSVMDRFEEKTGISLYIQAGKSLEKHMVVRF